MTRVKVSRYFDSGVGVLGAVVALCAVTLQVAHASSFESAYLLAVPLIMVMGWFPMLVGRRGGGIEIGLDTCILIFLGTMAQPETALVVWSLGVTLGQALAEKKRSTQIFNSALGVTAGGLAILVLELTRSGAPTSPRELLAAGLAGVVYFVVDFVVSAVSLVIDDESEIRETFSPTEIPGPLIAFMGIAALGYLGAVVVRHLPLWSAGLLVVPVATILVASRAQSRGAEQARRLKILLDTTVMVQTASDKAVVLELLRGGASDLLRDPRMEIRPEAPQDKEIGVAVHGSTNDLWIVGPGLSQAHSTRTDKADNQQALAALVAVAEDAFTRLQLSDDMAHQAWHDPLTGLPNRSLLMDRAEQAMATQTGRDGRLALLFCDLDGFKRVNDLFGHAAGDALLVEVGRRINACVRKDDTVARLGGDEFAVLLEGVEQTDTVTRTCERILDSLRRRSEVAGEDFSVTVTIGVAFSASRDSAETLLSHADLAMYHAKSQGKNRHEIYRLSFGDERLQRIELIEQLRRAIDDKQLEVFYQPIQDLRTREIYGVEALVRWRRDGILVPPDLFIPVAEESGLIVALGAEVLEKVAADVPKLRAAAGRTISIWVNISAPQLHDSDFISLVERTQARMGDVSLVLELTERDFVNDDQSTLAAMTALVESDVLLAVDDFGVGFSSLGYLQRLPVHILKIDHSFLTKIEDDERACALVRSMIVMGVALGLDVVIEGVEREAQLEHVVDHAGGSIGQGFLFAPPMCFRDMAAVLAQQPRRSPRRLAAIS
ncbi:MAG: EAL domain-containing protein [Actinomycetota bacterium]|nr:EAL domain-containing protein [Actinomycetota bacterium]